MNSVTGTPDAVERLDDDAGAERRRLQQRPVDVLGPGGQGLPDDQAGQLVVDQHRAVAGVPVERDQPVRADRLLGGQLGEVLVHVDARARAASAS